MDEHSLPIDHGEFLAVGSEEAPGKSEPPVPRQAQYLLAAFGVPDTSELSVDGT